LIRKSCRRERQHEKANLQRLTHLNDWDFYRENLAMKKLIFLSLFLFLALIVSADWIPEDGHKMHFPQTPKLQDGLDISFGDFLVGDDWQCSSTGTVDDIHFWISWNNNAIQTIENIYVAIGSDIPASESSTGYSTPGDPLWDRLFIPQDQEVEIVTQTPVEQGWFDIQQGVITGEIHDLWQQVNITDIINPFTQYEGSIYWLVIGITVQSSEGEPSNAGWKESGLHWNDNAVWLTFSPGEEWIELVKPDGSPIDLAFVITPEPATIAMLALGALLFRKR
jgi:hypothetical protein